MASPSSKREIFCTGVVLIADGRPDQQGDALQIEGIEFADVVPLTRNFDQGMRLGHAKLTRDGEKVVAEFALPTFKMPEFPLYPAIGGSIEAKEDMDDGTRLVTKAKITEISLSLTPNSDPRIEPIKQICYDGSCPKCLAGEPCR